MSAFVAPLVVYLIGMHMGKNVVKLPKTEVKKSSATRDKDKMNATQAMERLAEVMNNTPRTIKLGDKEWKITALKPGTQMLIASEAVQIQKAESANYSDVIKQFAVNTPAVVRVITLAILNDKEKIYDEVEYRRMYETIMWDTNPSDWITALVEVLQMLSLDFFFDSTSVIAMLRDMALGRKTTREEQRQSLAAQNGGK